MIKVFHAGYDEIKKPDVHRGRINADFGQGFYLSDNYEFVSNWVRKSPGADVIINSYELDDEMLSIKRFERDAEWFKYVFSNRRSMPDGLSEYDVIIGPIANDTIYNTLGIMTSGFLKDDEAMQLLQVGPLYYQIVLKTQKAADNLRFISSEILPDEIIEQNTEKFAADEEAYMKLFAQAMENTLS